MDRTLRGEQNDLAENARRGFVLARLAFVVLLGAALRAYYVNAPSLWRDEAFTWRLIAFSWTEMISRVGTLDAQPLFYYVFAKLWVSVFGESLGAMRASSILCDAVAAAAAYLFVRELLRPCVSVAARRNSESPAELAGLVAAGLLATNVFHVRYGIEFRMYALGAALALLTSWTLLRALRASTRPAGWWTAYTTLCVLFLYTHYYAIFTVAAQAAFALVSVLLDRREASRTALARRNLQGAAACFSAAAVAYLPWLPALSRQFNHVQQAFWTGRFDWRDVWRLPYQATVYPDSIAYASDASLLLAAALPTGALLLVLRLGRAGVFVFLLATAPLLLCIAASLRGTNVFCLRYLLFAHAFVLAAIAIAVATQLPRVAARIAGASLVVCSLMLTTDYFQSLDATTLPGSKGAAAYINQQRRPGEPIVTSTPLIHFSLLYALDNRRNAWICTHDVIPHYEGRVSTQPSDFLAPSELVRISSGRVWVVETTGWRNKMIDAPAHWRRLSHREFPELYAVQGTTLVTLYDASD